MFIFEGLNTEFIEDSKDYYEISKIFLKDGFFNDSIPKRPPLLSIIIVPFLSFFSEIKSIVFIKVLMLVLSSSTCLVIYLICIQLSLKKKISLLISLIYTFYPFSIFFSSRLLTENLASFLVSMSIFVFIIFLERKKIILLIITSIILGMLTLTRSSFYYFPIIFILTIFIYNFPYKLKFLYSVLIILVFYLTLSPWIYKNYKSYNHFIPTTIRLGYGLWLSNNDFNSKIIQKGGYERTIKFENEIINSSKMHPIEKSNYLKKKALDEISENKTIFIKTLFNRFVMMIHFKPNPYQKYKMTDYLMMVFWMPILILFFFSIWQNLNRKNIVIYLSIFYVIFVHLPFFGFPRFRYPVDCMIFLLALDYFFKKINLQIK